MVIDVTYWVIVCGKDSEHQPPLQVGRSKLQSLLIVVFVFTVFAKQIWIVVSKVDAHVRTLMSYLTKLGDGRNPQTGFFNTAV
jgi:hypothetical protein